MKRRLILSLIPIAILIGTALAACQPEEVVVTQIVAQEVTRVVTETEVVEGEVVVVTRLETVVEEVIVDVVTNDQAQEHPVEIVGEAALATAQSPSNAVANAQPQQRLIIKDGYMALTVEDADAAAEQAVQVTVDFGGYIIGQRLWTGERGFRYANIQLAVPVDQFENALSAFRTLGTVTDESATGEDVTDEYVDLNSRLGNLYATQDRLRTFLDQATNVTETLRVHEELTQIEAEIDVIQGRINYLSDRAAFSTITLDLSPFVPTPTPSPTATPSPTPLPPTPEIWSASNTAAEAAVQLQNTAQNTVDFAIFQTITCGPWLLVIVLVGYGLWQIRAFVLRRRERRRAVSQ